MTADDDYCIWIINSFQNFRTLRVEKKYTVYHNKKVENYGLYYKSLYYQSPYFFPINMCILGLHQIWIVSITIYIISVNMHQRTLKNTWHINPGILYQMIKSFGRFLMHDMICLKQIKMKTFSRKTKSASISDKYTVKLDFNEAICI